MTENKRCWVITDGRAGMVAGALGLAEAVARTAQAEGAGTFDIEEKVIRLKAPWRQLPPAFWPPGILGLDPAGATLAPPWPDLVISCGRHAVGPAIEIRRRSKGRAFAVHVQHPRVACRHFDLIAAPVHDRLSGPNVIQTHGALGRVSAERVAAEAQAMAERFQSLSKPIVAVAIGGDSKSHRLPPSLAAEIGRQLADMAKVENAALLVTASRRTRPDSERALRAALADVPGEFWDGGGINPYFAYLGVADAIIVTGDSVNMVSEACATGKPVMVIHLPSSGKSKFDLFHQDMEDAGATMPFRGRLEQWDYTPLQETDRVAKAVIAAMRQRGTRD